MTIHSLLKRLLTARTAGQPPFGEHQIYARILFALILMGQCNAFAQSTTLGNNATPQKPAAKQFLKSDDRIAFLGGGVIERMQESSWLEWMLTTADPSLTFRNIGWSGDTVYGDARGVFGGREDGFKRLLSDLDKAKPTVALVHYGDNECREGDAGLAEFEKGYRRLLAELSNRSIRVCLLLPRQWETGAIKNASIWNEQLAKYNRITRKLAEEFGHPLVDLENFLPGERLTTDGIYWTSSGYRLISAEIVRQIGVRVPDEWISLAVKDPNGANLTSYRELIRKKNEWFFHYYRPQNETYLFLFRKHEQGNNAPELEKILPVIESIEKQIRSGFPQKK